MRIPFTPNLQSLIPTLIATPFIPLLDCLSRLQKEKAFQSSPPSQPSNLPSSSSRRSQGPTRSGTSPWPSSTSILSFPSQFLPLPPSAASLGSSIAAGHHNLQPPSYRPPPPSAPVELLLPGHRHLLLGSTSSRACHLHLGLAPSPTPATTNPVVELLLPGLRHLQLRSPLPLSPASPTRTHPSLVPHPPPLDLVELNLLATDGLELPSNLSATTLQSQPPLLLASILSALPPSSSLASASLALLLFIGQPSALNPQPSGPASLPVPDLLS